MPVLPEEALQKLTCSSCKKYLSVFPIKVYYNKKVQCGRCEDKNGGTTSRLYELLAKQFEFPCVNRFEGCKDVLPASSVKKHETTCCPNEYACPLCGDFNGSAYDLLDHMQLNHKSAALENTDFLIDMDQGSTTEVYFYCKNDFFVTVGYQYDASGHQLTVNLDVFGKENFAQQNIMHQFLLYSVQNKLQYKTGDIRNSNSFCGDEELCAISLLRHKYPKNIIVCKFLVWDPTLWVAKKPQNIIKEHTHAEVQCNLPQIIDGSSGQAHLTFKFNNISQLARDKYTDSKSSYWVGDILWHLMIKRTQKDGLEVYLRREDTRKTCNVIFTIILISSTPGMNFYKHVVKDDMKEDWGYQHFLGWAELFNENRKFVRKNSVKFEVLLGVKPTMKGRR